MLRTLRIRNLVIIEDLNVEFGDGLNLLTGETGAGKSIVVDALGLVVGRRADRSLIRAGAPAAVVEALFEVGAGSKPERWLQRHGFGELEDGEIVVRREVPTSGGHRAWLNGSPCTQRLLRELGTRLLEIHGQHEHQSLLSAERHLELIDRWGGHGRRLERVSSAFQSLRSRRDELAELLDQAVRREDEAQRLREGIREIDAVEPRPDELDALGQTRTRLRNAESLLELLENVIRLTYDGEPAAAGLAATAARSAAELSRLDPELTELAHRLESAVLELQDVGSAFRDYREGHDFDPGRLEAIEARRVALERLCLRFGEDEAAVLAWREEARQALDRIENVDREIDEARAKEVEAEREYLEATEELTRERRRGAKRIVAALQKQLGGLALGEARIDVTFSPGRGESIRSVPLSRRGAERAELMLAANPGEPFRPLSRVASGGELSRVMLAVHGVFDGAGEGRTLVFDEVDAGVGGAVADAIGRRLAAVAAREQVLCVTHLPQVAAHAERHLVVSKRVQSGRTQAEIRLLSQEGRVDELARMLAGRRPTEASRRHASELLGACRASATRPRPELP